MGEANVGAERDDSKGEQGGDEQEPVEETHQLQVSESDQAVGKEGGEEKS